MAQDAARLDNFCTSLQKSLEKEDDDAESIGAAGFVAVLKDMWQLEDINEKSVFCDVGSGTGRPCLFAAGLKMKAIVGFDVDTAQVQKSYMNLKKVQRRLLTNVVFFQSDMVNVKSLDPVTHAFAFITGELQMMQFAALIARSSTLRVVGVVTPLGSHATELNGLYTTYEEDENIFKVQKSGKTMRGSNYGFSFRMNPEFRSRIFKALHKLRNLWVEAGSVFLHKRLEDFVCIAKSELVCEEWGKRYFTQEDVEDMD